MRRRSAKMEAKYVERRKLVARLLEERPTCEACPTRSSFPRESVDLHELKNRSQGGDILDEDQIICVCRVCHDWIGAHPHIAELRGLHVPGWAPYEFFGETIQIRKSYEFGLPIVPSWID